MLSDLVASRRTVLFGLAASTAAIGLPLKARVGAPLETVAIPFVVPDKLAGAAELVPASRVRLGGWLGNRVAKNATARLSEVDLEPFLAGFRKKPGSHPWIGEHIGKWMHAATLAWAQTGNPRLKQRLDYAAAELIKTQEADGYLGTYIPEKRFIVAASGDWMENTGWDVWSHKYCMLGLLNYYRYTRNEAALNATRRAADLLLRTFPAKRSILEAGYHAGMAATSVLEPMVLLHRVTGDPRYLDFAHYLVRSWEEPKGPKLLSTLLSTGKVERVGNAKAYEMLSNIVGLCELARVTGDTSLVRASIRAWEDIVATQRVITGATSDGEYFQPDGEIRAEHMPRLGETCVTTTWIQLNQALYQLTGEARFGNELERTYYNALTAAQHPDGHDWCYFTPMNGKKKYDKDITCCHSSGPRGVALAPLSAYLTSSREGDDFILVSTLESSDATLDLGGRIVRIQQTSKFPETGWTTLRLSLSKPARFGLRVRVPEWSAPMRIEGAVMRDGWAEIAPRHWKSGDTVQVAFNLNTALINGTGDQDGRQIQAFGPFILAYEKKPNNDLPPADLLEYTAAAKVKSIWPALQFEAPISAGRPPHHHDDYPEALAAAKLVPYADAGVDGDYYRLWLMSRA